MGPDTPAGLRPDPVAAAIEELYGLPPKRFVARRTELARAAKSSAAAGTAAQIAALRKPTLAAYAVNLLVRSAPEEVSAFLDLGGSLRDATAAMSGTELRTLSRQRHQLVLALVRQARAAALEQGNRLGDDVLRSVEETLHAALASPDAAQDVRRGQLTAPLSATGFGAGAPATPVGPAATRDADSAASRASGRTQTTSASTSADRGAARDRQARLRRDLEGQLAAAWTAAREAADARDASARRLDQAQAGVADTERCASRLGREAERLRAALAECEAELELAEHEHAAATAELEDARALHRRAERAATSARNRVTDLQSRLDGT